MRAIGLVEAPIVTPDKMRSGTYLLLDGHLRVEALRDLGVSDVECLVSTDDEAYTYNKRLNRLAAVQEHKMIVRAVERGVFAERIAEALGLDVATIQRRFRMVDGICAEAIELLEDTPCPMVVFLQSQVKSIEDSYGVDNLHLTVAKAYVAKLLENSRVVRWLAQSRQGYLTEFQTIAELNSIRTGNAAAE